MTKIGGGESPYHVNMENNSGVQRKRTSMDASDEKKGAYTIPVSIYKPSGLSSYLFNEKVVYMKPEDHKVYQKFLNEGYEPSQFLSDDSDGKPNLYQGRGTATYVEGTQKF
jgi:hypothetical protein